MVELGEREIALAPSCACGPRDRSTDLRASTSRLSASACKGNGRAEEKLVGITRRVGRTDEQGSGYRGQWHCSAAYNHDPG